MAGTWSESTDGRAGQSAHSRESPRAAMLELIETRPFEATPIRDAKPAGSAEQPGHDRSRPAETIHSRSASGLATSKSIASWAGREMMIFLGNFPGQEGYGPNRHARTFLEKHLERIRFRCCAARASGWSGTSRRGNRGGPCRTVAFASSHGRATCGIRDAATTPSDHWPALSLPAARKRPKYRPRPGVSGLASRRKLPMSMRNRASPSCRPRRRQIKRQPPASASAAPSPPRNLRTSARSSPSAASSTPPRARGPRPRAARRPLTPPPPPPKSRPKSAWPTWRRWRSIGTHSHGPSRPRPR